MGIMDWLKGRQDKTNIEYARTVGIAQSQIAQSGVDTHELEMSLGVRDAVIHDKGAEAIYDSELFDSEVVVEDGKRITKPLRPNYDGQALRLFLSPKLALGNIDKQEAKYQLLLAEREAINIEMNGKEKDYLMGKGSRFTAQLLHIRQGILGSVEGKTMRNLLMTPHVTRVETGELPKKRNGLL